MGGSDDVFARAQAGLDDALANRHAALPGSPRCERLRAPAAGVGRSRSGPLRRTGTRCSRGRGARIRHGARRSAKPRRTCVRIAGMGFDVVYLPPIHPIGTTLPEGAGQHAGACTGRSRQPLGDRVGGGRSQGGGPGTRHPRGLRSFRPTKRVDSDSRSRSTSPTSARRTIRTSASIRNGSAIGRTARSSTRRIRPRNTRTSTRSTSKARRGTALWAGAEVGRGVLDRRGRAHLPRGQSAHQAVPLLGVAHRARSGAIIRTRSSCPRRSRGRRSCTTWPSWGSRSRIPTSRGGTRRPELTDYFTELTQTEVAEFFRPNLFANTPDILHAYLQKGGRRRSRSGCSSPPRWARPTASTAGSSSASTGRCRAREEYLDSEKYQYRQWDWDRPGHIATS